jgi:hypothetical protein
MASKNESASPATNVNVGISAKASFEARVSTEIPPQATGRLIDAVTDIFRPFSERRGLRADQIRLQREDVLLEIAKRAQTRLAIEGAAIAPIPNKVLIPFMEKASLEDRDSLLIDRWSDLLVSAAKSPQSVHPRFVQILSEMTSEEALLLKRIATNGEFARFRLVDSSVEFELHAARSGLIQLVDTLFGSSIPHDEGELEDQIIRKNLYGRIREYFCHPGVCPVLIMIAINQTDVWSTELVEDTIEDIINQQERAVNVLQSLHLLEKHHIILSKGSLEIDAYYLMITELGIDLPLKFDAELGA